MFFSILYIKCSSSSVFLCFSHSTPYFRWGWIQSLPLIFTIFWVLSSIKALIRHEIREVNWTICLLNSNEFLKRSLCKTVPVADNTTVVEYSVYSSYPYISFLTPMSIFNILSIHTLSGFSRCSLPAERESFACSLRQLYHHHHYHYQNHYRCRYHYRYN